MQTESVNNSVTVRQEVTGYGMRFDDIVTSPNYYRFEIEALQVATENTPVDITVNTDGGSLATGIEMVNEIINCKAKVTGILRSSCHSCGSIIFLACDEHEVGLSSEMLLHSGSGGAGGTPSQTVQRAESYKRQVRSLFETVYKGFLSQEEIDLMIEHDKEFIFCSDEIKERLQRMYTYRSQQHSSAMEEMFTLQNEQSEKYENILIKRLLEKGEITQEEADIARKVQAATVSLDETEGDSLFESIHNSCEDESCTMMCGYDSNPSKLEDKDLTLFDVKGMQWKVDFTLDGDDNIDDIVITNANQDYWTFNKRDLSDTDIDNLKALADDWEIPYVHNIGVETLSDKIISYFELEIIEFLSQ